MQGFETMPALSEVIGAYPEAKKIVSAASSGGRNSKMAIARLWLSEGIPFAFKDCPAIYESIRVWLSSRLLVHPKDISITGSARLGQSLAPQKLGKEFSHESDLDLFIEWYVTSTNFLLTMRQVILSPQMAEKNIFGNPMFQKRQEL